MSSRFLVLLIAVFGITAAVADVYTWVDDEGQVHYSDKPDELPAEIVSIESRPTDLARMSEKEQDDQYLSQARDLREEQQAFLFGKNSDAVNSVALIPLSGAKRMGILALGSEDETRFHPGMGTVFISHLGELISTSLTRHLK